MAKHYIPCPNSPPFFWLLASYHVVKSVLISHLIVKWSKVVTRILPKISKQKKKKKIVKSLGVKKDFILAFSKSIWLHCVGSVLVGIVHRMSMTVIWMQMSLISALRLLFLDNNSSRLGAYWARLKLGRDNIAKNNSFTWPCQTNKQKNRSNSEIMFITEFSLPNLKNIL